MSLPSGVGTEVLRRATLHDNTGYNTILSGSTGHVYVIVSLIFCNNTGTTYGCAIRVNDGTNNIELTTTGGQSVAPDETYVWNDRFIIEEDDDLLVTNDHADGDWYLTYIDQHLA